MLEAAHQRLRAIAQLAVDLAVELAGGEQVGESRGEHHRDRHRGGRDERDAPAEAHGSRRPQRRIAVERSHQVLQNVAHAAHGVQQAWLAAGLGLAAQIAHVDAQRVRARAEVIAPHVLEDDRAGEHLLGVAQEQLEQQELGAREVQRALPAPGLVGEPVQAQVLEAQRLLLVDLVRSPEQRAHARHQLAQGERLDEVVVRAGVQAGDAVVDLLARGEHQHRRAVAALAHTPAHFQAVEHRHRDVEDDRVVGALAEALQRVAAVAGERDLVALERQRPRQRVLDGGLVVNDQYARGLCHVCFALTRPGQLIPGRSGYGDGSGTKLITRPKRMRRIVDEDAAEAIRADRSRAEGLLADERIRLRASTPPPGLTLRAERRWGHVKPVAAAAQRPDQPRHLLRAGRGSAACRAGAALGR